MGHCRAARLGGDDRREERAPARCGTTDWDIIEALHLGYRQDVVDQATLGLWRRDSTQSARAVLLRSQRIVLGVLLAALVVGLVLAPLPTLTTLTAVISVAYLLAVHGGAAGDRHR